MKVNKLDVAYEQLVTAVRLYMADAHPIPTWTLTAAGYEIVQVINRRLGGESMMVKEQLVDQVDQPLRSRLWKNIQRPQNYFKHADRDHAEVLRIPEEGKLELLLFDAILAYRRIVGSWPAEFWVFQGWALNVLPLPADDGGMDKLLAGAWKRREGESRSRYRDRLWNTAVLAASDYRGHRHIDLEDLQSTQDS